MYRPNIPTMKRVASYRRQVVEINIYSDAIFKRVDDDTQLLSQVRSVLTGGDTNDTHSLSTDDNARGRLRAFLDKYFLKVRHLMVAYLVKDDKTVVSSDNVQTQWAKRNIWLLMPQDWNRSNLEELANLVSEYIVSGIEYEFLLMAFGATDANVLQRLDAMNSIASAITSNLSLRTPAHLPSGFPSFSS